MVDSIALTNLYYVLGTDAVNASFTYSADSVTTLFKKEKNID